MQVGLRFQEQILEWQVATSYKLTFNAQKSVNRETYMFFFSTGNYCINYKFNFSSSSDGSLDATPDCLGVNRRMIL